MTTLESMLDSVVRKTEDFDRTGRVRPAWLQKQVDATYLLETDYERGLALLREGFQDELEFLEAHERTYMQH